MVMRDILKIANDNFDGVKESDMSHIPEVSTYNHNYYSLNGNLLLGVSDDDNFTQWYWVLNEKFIAIGGSYCSDGNRIIVNAAFT